MKPKVSRRLGFQFISVVAMLLVVMVVTHAQDSRKWTSNDGKYSVQAEFLKLSRGKVHLRRQDGKEITVPLERLSDADRAWVRTTMRDRSEQRKKAKRAGRGDAPTQQPTSEGEAKERSNSGDASWYQWRGPNRDGKSADTGLLSSWKTTAPKLLWTASGLGKGRASVVVVGGKIYTMGVLHGEACIIAVDESDGRILWSSPIDGDSNVNCTPTYADGRLYGITFRGTLGCVRAEDGELSWKRSFSRDFGGKMMSGWGYAESPLVDGDQVIVTPGSPQAMMVALNTKNGELIWKSVTAPAGKAGNSGAAYSSAVISQAGGVRQYVQLVGGGLIGVAAENGRLLWSYEKIANSTANVPTPIVSGNYVFCSTGYQTGAALLEIVRRGNRFAAREVYFLPHQRLQNHHGGMILLGEFLFCGHGHNQGFPICIHLPTGRTAWGPERGPGKRSAAIAYAEGHLYFRYEDGTMALVEADPRQYKLKGTFKIATRHAESWPHPVIAGGKLYLRDQNDLHCYDLRKEQTE